METTRDLFCSTREVCGAYLKYCYRCIPSPVESLRFRMLFEPPGISTYPGKFDGLVLPPSSLLIDTINQLRSFRAATRKSLLTNVKH